MNRSHTDWHSAHLPTQGAAIDTLQAIISYGGVAPDSYLKVPDISDWIAFKAGRYF